MLLLATANPHKVEEMQAIFATLLPDLRLLSLADLPGGPPPEPAETGTTFEQNATIKARAYAAASGMACLADDSGLEIDALQGRPGVISSHYCTDGQETGMTRAQRDQANNQRVLRELEGVPPHQRTARFVCTMALCLHTANTTCTLVRGTFEGRIGLPTDVPRGSHGFGYDPLFLVAPDFTHTGAELDPATKNRLSHRAAAAGQMAQHIRTLLAADPDALGPDRS
jgi:XTP/dITP diphosphohydrolase